MLSVIVTPLNFYTSLFVTYVLKYTAFLMPSLKINWKDYMRLGFLSLIVMLCCSPVSAQEGRKYYKLTPQEVVKYAQSTPARKVVFIYATWCPHCRKAFPKLIALEKQRPGSVIAVSVDRDFGALVKYLGKYSDLPFYPIFLKGNNSSGIEKILNVAPHRGVPYFILMDEKGKAAHSGNMRVSDIAQYILTK